MVSFVQVDSAGTERVGTHGGFIETALPQRSSAQMVMKYHAEDTSTLNGPRWFNRFRVDRAEPDAASFGRAVSMKPPRVPTRIVLSFLNHVFASSA